jgi:hypothetical protein
MELVSNLRFFPEFLTASGEQILRAQECVVALALDSRLRWKMRAFTMVN